MTDHTAPLYITKSEMIDYQLQRQLEQNAFASKIDREQSNQWLAITLLAITVLVEAVVIWYIA